MRTKHLQTRSKPNEDLTYRSFSVRKLQADQSGSAPSTLDREKRSVEVLAATENPVNVFDMERWEVVPEVLLMSGARIPKSRQVPLLDSHSRFSSADVMGSAREMRVDGSELVSTAIFSSVQRSDEIFTKVEEGHLTDFSLGYRVNKSVWIPEGQSQVVNGRTFKGPVKVATDWTPRELSITPIGADELSKARSARSTQEGKEKMEKKLREFLESRGLAKDATEDQAWAYLEKLDVKRELPAPAPGSPPEAKTEEQIRAEAVKFEQDRIFEIRSMCETFHCSDMADELIRGGMAIDQARKSVMDKISKNFTEGHGYRPPVGTGADERDKFRSAATDAVCMRSGVAVEKPAAGANELRGWTLKELARESLRMAGLSTHGDIRDIVGRALTTSDFPIILGAGANRALLAGWQAQAMTWRTWCGVGSLPDFKAMNLVVPGEFGDLDEIPDHGEYKYGGRSEKYETAQLATYGKLFSITRHSIINDDLGALSDVPMGHGRAAARKVNALAYAVLTANAAMKDNKALFHADHGNLGTVGVPNIATISEAIKLMRLQKNLDGKEFLEIRPQYFIGPVALEGVCEQFFNSAFEGTQAKPNLVNPYAGKYFTRVYAPQLDAVSADAWFIAGDKGMTVVVFFLNGVETPYLEEKTGWSVDGVEYKVRIDAAAKAVDWRGLVKNAGK